MHVLLVPSWYPAHPNDVKGSFFRDQALVLKRHGIQVGVIAVQLHSPRAWKTMFKGPFGIFPETDKDMPTLRLHGMNWFPRLPCPYRRLWLRHGMKLFERYLTLYGRLDLLHAHSMLNGGILAKSVFERFGIYLSLLGTAQCLHGEA